MLNSLTHIEVIGHTHHVTEMLKTIHTKNGIRFAGIYSTGTGARLDEMVPANGSRNDWQQAIAEVIYTNSYEFVNIINVVNGHAVINDNLIIGENRTEEIASDINWNGLLG